MLELLLFLKTKAEPPTRKVAELFFLKLFQIKLFVSKKRFAISPHQACFSIDVDGVVAAMYHVIEIRLYFDKSWQKILQEEKNAAGKYAQWRLVATPPNRLSESESVFYSLKSYIYMPHKRVM